VGDRVHDYRRVERIVRWLKGRLALRWRRTQPLNQVVENILHPPHLDCHFAARLALHLSANRPLARVILRSNPTLGVQAFRRGPDGHTSMHRFEIYIARTVLFRRTSPFVAYTRCFVRNIMLDGGWTRSKRSRATNQARNTYLDRFDIALPGVEAGIFATEIHLARHEVVAIVEMWTPSKVHEWG
jgi:hypothetical protein